MKVYTTRPRPEVIPSGWTIYNAPRPLYGDKEWASEFALTGIFFAAVDPNGDQAAWMIRRNEENQAAEVVYTTEEDVIETYLCNNPYAAKHREMLADAALWKRQVLHVLEMLNTGRLEL